MLKRLARRSIARMSARRSGRASRSRKYGRDNPWVLVNVFGQWRALVEYDPLRL